MTQAGNIRQYVIEHWLEPARRSGANSVTVRAGDVHKAMGLSNAYPAVCSVLGSNKFATEASVIVDRRDGPANGANAYFTFSLHPTKRASVDALRRGGRQQSERLPRGFVSTSDPLNWSDALVLISCVKSKLPYRAPAADLYVSPQFQMSRQLAEARGADFMILSARYGLIEPTSDIEPYDFTLKTLGVAERREWAATVLKELLTLARRKGRVIFLAGERYREFLVGPLRQNGVEVEVPMKGLRQGEQLAWLSNRL